MKFKVKDVDLVDNELMEIIRRFPIDFRLAGVTPEDRLKGLQPEDRLKGLQPEEILKVLISEDRLKKLDPEKLVAGMSRKNLEKLRELLDRLN